MPRPKSLVAVCGTTTEVGKTWVGAAVLAQWAKAGLSVAARKPVQSFDPADAHPTDAHVLGSASGEPADRVCPPHRWYGRALAPPMAAEALGRSSFSLADLLGELHWPPACEVGLVETVGGVRSPMAADGDCASFVQRIAPDATLLVADAELGTINAVRLSMATLNPERVVVFLNRFDSRSDLHQRNLAWLSGRDGLTVLTDAEAAATALVR